MARWPCIVLLGIQLVAAAQGECLEGKCMQAGTMGNSLLSRRSALSKTSLNTSSELDAANAWAEQFIQTWISQNQHMQFTCQVTPIEVVPPGTAAKSSSMKETLTAGLGAGATLMNAAGGLALVGQTFGTLSMATGFGVGGIVASTAMSVVLPYLFPGGGGPTLKELINEAEERIYKQMNVKVAELQACVNAAVGNTLVLGGQLSHALAKMAHAIGLAHTTRSAITHMAGLDSPGSIQIKAHIVDEYCNSHVEGYRMTYGSDRIVVPYMTAQMRMCFGFYVGWALAEFDLIQKGQSTQTRFNDVLTMMTNSMNRFGTWFDGVSGSGPQISEYKRSVVQTKTLTEFLKECNSQGDKCKWYEPQTFHSEVLSITDQEIKKQSRGVLSSRWRATFPPQLHDAELRCFQCSTVTSGIDWVRGGPDKFFQHHFWYAYYWHPDIQGRREEDEMVPIPPRYVCAYGRPTYYKAKTLQERNDVFDRAGQECGTRSVPWLYWRTQEQPPGMERPPPPGMERPWLTQGLVQEAVAERRAARASTEAKIEAMPSGCQTFATICLQGQQGQTSAEPWRASWSDLSAGITLCCMAGHHSEAFCSELADELLSHHEDRDNVTLTQPFCDELEELTRIQDKWSQQPSSLVQESSREAKLARMSRYLSKVHHKAGALIEYLGGAALTTSLSLLAGASTSGALVSAVTGVLVTHMQSCCENACETRTVGTNLQCACWLEGGGW